MLQLLHPIPFLLALFFFLFFKSNPLKSKNVTQNLPPGPTPLPFIGNLLHLGPLPHISLRKLAQKHGPIMHLKLGQIPTIVISSKQTAFQILKTQDRIFCSRPQLVAASLLSYNGNDIAFSPYNDHLRKMRRFCNAEFFSATKVQSFRPVRDREIGILVETVRRDCGDGKMVNLSEMAVCFFNNVVYGEVFGKRTSGEGECRESRYEGLIRAVIDILPGFSVGDMFPMFWWVDWVTGWRWKLERSFREVDRLFDEEIRERKMRRKEEGEENFVDLLLRCEVEKHPLLGFLLSRNDTKALIVDLFFTATETAAVTVEWAMSELMKNPKSMKKTQEELRRVVAAGKPKVEEEDLKHLHYLKLVLNETLRLHLAAPLLGQHECTENTKVNGFNIPANTRVIINASAIGRDPKIWENPESFEPERFLNSDLNYKGGCFEFIPFGSGRRICPGMGHGVVGVEMVLANLLYGFDWEMVEGDLDMEERYGVSISRKNPLILMPKFGFM